MKTLIVLLALATPALAQSYRRPAIDCATIRAYVAQVGAVQARQLAYAAGMTRTQERQARQCLARR